MEDIKGCHILFVSVSEEDALESIFDRIQGQSILTVSELEQFAPRGGMISLIKVGDNFRFEVNAKAARDVHLSISSQLLKLALRVHSAGESDRSGTRSRG